MLPVVAFGFIFRKHNHVLVQDVTQFFMRVGMKAILFCAGTRVKIEGYENVPLEPVLFISNHRSMFDIVLAYANVDKRLAFVGKKETRSMVLVGWIMELMGGMFLDRNDIRQGMEVINKAIDFIKKDGYSIWICPEGTRSKTADESELLPFHSGSFHVALKSGCKIVPVRIKGSREIFEAHMPWPKATDVTIKFLPAIDYDKGVTETVREMIKNA